HLLSCHFLSVSSFSLPPASPPPPPTLSLHDALPISYDTPIVLIMATATRQWACARDRTGSTSQASYLRAAGTHAGVPSSHLLSVDRKSTRLNSSHRTISYAVFCLKKKKKHLDMYQT